MRPSARPSPSIRLRLAALAIAPIVVLARPAAAQDADPGAQGPGDADPVFVVSRTVHPRVAYKGLEPQQNPVHTQATMFPGRVFHDTLGAALGELADAALTEHASAGVATDAHASGLATSPAQDTWLGARGGLATGQPGQATGTAPVGAMGSAIGGAGGAVRTATGAIGALLGEGLKNTSPVQQGGGG
jgi:hypothetical protein